MTPPPEGTPGTLAITGDAAADDLLNTDPLALLVGMLLDQQVPMEWAFRGPATLVDRLGHLDVAAVADMDPEAFLDACRAKPAIHRFPKSRAGRIPDLCRHIGDHHGGAGGTCNWVFKYFHGVELVYARLGPPARRRPAFPHDGSRCPECRQDALQGLDEFGFDPECWLCDVDTYQGVICRECAWVCCRACITALS